jgi:hypothetical protein
MMFQSVVFQTKTKLEMNTLQSNDPKHWSPLVEKTIEFGK